MKKRNLIFILGLLILYGCVQEEFLLCPDGVTKVIDLENCPIQTPSCPESCDDGDACTLDTCSRTTGYACLHKEISPCDGNGVCEEGEFPWSEDCPQECNDGDACTEDYYNFQLGRCLSDPILPCCGDNLCSGGENFFSCALDCEQQLEIKVTEYEKRNRIPNVDIDLSDTDHTYLIVRFKIKNLGIDKPEILDYKQEQGFYYDPFKMRLEDETGRLYNVEYDSDLLRDWLDYTIIEKGRTTGASLLFIVPKVSEHTRLIAYDRQGGRLDHSEIY